MLNKAQNLLNQQMKDREAVANDARATIKDAQEALRILGYESIESLEEVIPVITINKGRVVAAQVTNDEEIEQLKDELHAKELLINDFRETVDKNIKDMQMMRNEIQVYKGMAAGYEAQLTNKDLIIESLEKQIADMKEDQLRKEIKETKEEAVTEEQQTIEGGDAMSTPLQQAKDAVEAFLNGRSFSELTFDEIGTLSDLQDEVKRLEKLEEEEARKAQLPEYSLDYTQITYDKSIDSRTMFGICGTITIAGKAYAFKATNNHAMPIIYGCMDMDVIQLAKDIITNDVEKFNFINEDKNAINFDHINDTQDKIVVWRLADDKGHVRFHGYSDKYIIVWEPSKYDVPSRKMMKYALDENPKHFRKIEQQKNAKKLSDKFMAVCANIWPEDFTNDDNDPEPTKEKHQTTKEQQQSTKEFFHITKEQHQVTEDELSNMIHERHQRAKENRIDDIQTVIKYEGDFVDVTKVINCTAEDEAMANECDDLDF